MRFRCLAITLVVFGTVAVARAETPKPNVIIQAKPLDEWLLDAKQLAKDLGPLLKDIQPGGQDPAKFIDDALAKFLGQDWRKVIDSTKSFGAYGMVKDDLADGVFVALLPVKDVKEAVKWLANFGIAPEEKNGLYTFKSPNNPMTVFARAANGYVYASRTVDALAPENLLGPDAVFAGKETSSLVARIRLDAISAEVKKKLVGDLDNAIEQDKSAEAEYVKKFAKEMVDSLKMVFEDGREWSLGLDFDRKHGELALVTEIVPKPGTPLAKEYKEAKPTTSRFAAMGEGAAAFAVQRYGMPALGGLGKEIDKPIDEFHAKLAELGFKIEKEQLAKLFRTVVACADIGVTDVGIGLYVGADRKATAVYALRVKDGEKAERAAVEFVKSAPDSIRQRVKLNAGKIGVVNLHRIDLSEQAPEALRKIFGKAEIVLAIANDAVVAAIGPDGEKRIKVALESKPQPAPLILLEGSLVKLWPLIEELATDDAQRAQMKKARAMLGKDLDRVHLLHLTRTPGESMKYRLGVDLIPIMRFAFMFLHAEPAPGDVKPSAVEHSRP